MPNVVQFLHLIRIKVEKFIFSLKISQRDREGVKERKREMEGGKERQKEIKKKKRKNEKKEKSKKYIKIK